MHLDRRENIIIYQRKFPITRVYFTSPNTHYVITSKYEVKIMGFDRSNMPYTNMFELKNLAKVETQARFTKNEKAYNKYIYRNLFGIGATGLKYDQNKNYNTSPYTDVPSGDVPARDLFQESVKTYLLSEEKFLFTKKPQHVVKTIFKILSLENGIRTLQESIRRLQPDQPDRQKLEKQLNEVSAERDTETNRLYTKYLTLNTENLKYGVKNASLDFYKKCQEFGACNAFVPKYDAYSVARIIYDKTKPDSPIRTLILENLFNNDSTLLNKFGGYLCEVAAGGSKFKCVGHYNPDDSLMASNLSFLSSKAFESLRETTVPPVLKDKYKKPALLQPNGDWIFFLPSIAQNANSVNEVINLFKA